MRRMGTGGAEESGRSQGHQFVNRFPTSIACHFHFPVLPYPAQNCVNPCLSGDFFDNERIAKSLPPIPVPFNSPNPPHPRVRTRPHPTGDSPAWIPGQPTPPISCSLRLPPGAAGEAGATDRGAVQRADRGAGEGDGGAPPGPPRRLRRRRRTRQAPQRLHLPPPRGPHIPPLPSPPNGSYPPPCTEPHRRVASQVACVLYLVGYGSVVGTATNSAPGSATIVHHWTPPASHGRNHATLCGWHAEGAMLSQVHLNNNGAFKGKWGKI